MKKACSDNSKKTSIIIIINLSLLLLIAIVVALCIGKYDVSPGESLKILFCKIIRSGCDASDMTQNVVLRLRLPRILASVLVGAALSMSGAAYQGIFKNPLISPDFLGVSSGACIGAAVAILMSLSSVWISLCAFAGGLLAVFCAVSLPVIFKNRSNIMLVLSGIIVGSAMSSVLGFIKYVADPTTQLASITYWSMGSFSYIKSSQALTMLLVMIIPAGILIGVAWWIDVLSMGEKEAQSLGVNVRLVRGLIILCATLLTASSVCVAGTVGWVGLIVPHLCRMIYGPSNKRLIPAAGLMGGLFLLIVDTLTRTISIDEMPVSILTGAIGAPFYCYLLYKQRRLKDN